MCKIVPPLQGHDKNAKISIRWRPSRKTPYVNFATVEVRREPPIAQETPDEEWLPPGWRAMKEEGDAGKEGYVNLNTDHSNWNDPRKLKGGIT